MKYLVEVTYKARNPHTNTTSHDYIDTLIVNSVGNYNRADRKIREFLAQRYQNDVLIDIRINSYDMIEQITIK